MNKTVGVKSWISTILSPSIKREALLFDQIAITQFDSILSLKRQHSTLPDYNIYDLEWLHEQGIIISLGKAEFNPQLKLNREYAKYYNLAEEGLKKLELAAIERLLSYERKGNQKVRKTSSTIRRQDAKFYSLGPRASDYEARCAAIQFRELYGLHAHPIISSPIPSLEDPKAKKTDVLQIVLRALPIPSEMIPWEAIIDFRNDPNTAFHLLALKNWMAETAKAQLSPLEIEEKVEYLINKYQQHLKLHKMKTKAGTMETVVVASAEFLEDMVKFRWGKIAKSLFSFKHRRVALMEGELTAPGNEVAYIVKARQGFS